MHRSRSSSAVGCLGMGLLEESLKLELSGEQEGSRNQGLRFGSMALPFLPTLSFPWGLHPASSLLIKQCFNSSLPQAGLDLEKC